MTIYNIILNLFRYTIFPLFIVVLYFFKKERAIHLSKRLKFKYYNPDQDKTKKNILIHAVSVGETEAVKPLVEKLLLEGHNITISTVTTTGKEMVKKTFQDRVDHIFFPLDFRKNCIRFLKRIKPYIIIMAETEIWPNFLHTCHSLSIPIMVVNGRISPESYKNYMRFKYLIGLKDCLDIYDTLLMQSDIDLQRMINMGASDEKTMLMGNLKFDSLIESENSKSEKNIDLELKIPKEHKVIIAGSTHQGEDEIFIEVLSELKKEDKNITGIIAPRHLKRIDEIIKIIKSFGLNFILKSKIKDTPSENTDIIILDTIGELKFIYGLADIAFIGGSISNTGGHNILESIKYGIPTFFGPNMFNFEFIKEQALKFECGFLIEDKTQLYDGINYFLKNPDQSLEIENRAVEMIKKNKGALSIALRVISHYL
ncbi:MAG: hypothetical protein C0601_00420 [Candidatus Muiribacterium halophilum]|uniref:3-deoxy-D-manno-octulosonic acid transferase n=1 Tax=Muiribacterium halophilum TaxID=2053465 RepID=A0A2N5ZN11_MUIH1|nr:MAG: hypothetical protein C0601_00420 [Candidatus Muirbacterium halophilum]